LKDFASGLYWKREKSFTCNKYQKPFKMRRKRERERERERKRKEGGPTKK